MIYKVNHNYNMKYRKLPVEIEAIQLTTENFDKICDFIGTTPIQQLNKEREKTKNYSLCSYSGIYIKTLEGDMLANINDYIIKGINGEFYPCKPDIFEKTYEEVEEERWNDNLIIE